MKNRMITLKLSELVGLADDDFLREAFNALISKASKNDLGDILFQVNCALWYLEESEKRRKAEAFPPEPIQEKK